LLPRLARTTRCVLDDAKGSLGDAQSDAPRHPKAHPRCWNPNPFLPAAQGSRLTAYELVYENIPGTLICDSMAAYKMSLGDVDAIVVGADRVTANGDTANKIGTYVLLGDAKSSLGDAEGSLGDAKSSLGDAKSSLGDAESSLGDAEGSLGDAKSSLGDAKSSLGDAESSLGDQPI
jgi:hypothetical protein